jgi:hypothetical protein
VLLKTTLTLAAHVHPERSHALDHLWGCVRDDGDLSCHVDYGFPADAPPWTPASDLDPLSHRLIFLVAEGELRADVRLFGNLAFCLCARLPTVTPPWAAAYAVDPFTGRDELAPSIACALPLAHRSPEQFQAALDVHAASLEAIRARQKELSTRALSDRICNEVFIDLFGSTDGVPATPENIARIEAAMRDAARRYGQREDHEVPAPHLLERVKPRPRRP